ncbi:hypothetical protein AABB24_017272, partial [Solanum stoloniferum]
ALNHLSLYGASVLVLNSYLQLSFPHSAEPQLNLVSWLSLNFTFVSLFVVMMSMNSGFVAHSDRALFLIHAQYIDGVFVTDDAASLFRTNPHLSQPHNHRSRNSSHRSRNTIVSSRNAKP